MFYFSPKLLEEVATDAVIKHQGDLDSIMKHIINELEVKTGLKLKRNVKWDFIDQGGQLQLVNNLYVGRSEVLSFFGFVTNDDTYQYYYQRYDTGDLFFDRVIYGKACFLMDKQNFSLNWKNIDENTSGLLISKKSQNTQTPLWQGLNGILLTYQRNLSILALLNHFIRTILTDPVYGIGLLFRTIVWQIKLLFKI